MINNVKVYDLEESIKASKYPKSVDLDSLDSETTNTVKSLASYKKGTGHDQFLTGIIVNFDLTASNKLWVEMQRYAFVNFVSSQSTMHRMSRFNLENSYTDHVDKRVVEIMKELRDKYKESKSKEDFYKLIYTNPAGFRLTARLTTNYRSLKTIYAQRRNHRLDEWKEICAWIETLPMSELIVGGIDNE